MHSSTGRRAPRAPWLKQKPTNTACGPMTVAPWQRGQAWNLYRFISAQLSDVCLGSSCVVQYASPFQAYIPRCWLWLRLRFLLLLLCFFYFCTSYYLMASPTIEIGFCSQLASCLVSNGGRQQSHDWSVLRTAAHVFKNKCKPFGRGWRTSDLDERNSWSYTLFTSRCLSYLVTLWCNGTPSSAKPSTIISTEDKGRRAK